MTDFMFYLEVESDVDSLAEAQGFHLSHFSLEFWDENLGPDTPFEVKKQAIETIRNLYDYLAKQKYISGDAAQRIAQAAATLLSRPNRLTAIEQT